MEDVRLLHLTHERLLELRDVCEQVIEASKLIDGHKEVTVYNKENPQGEPRLEPTRVIKDKTVAERLLPIWRGRCYEQVSYDKEYLKAVVDTLHWIDRMREEPGCRDFIGTYYSATW